MANILSTDTFDLVDSSIIFEAQTQSGMQSFFGVQFNGGNSSYAGFDIFNHSNALAAMGSATGGSDTGIPVIEAYTYYKLSISGSVLSWHIDSGSGFVLGHSQVLTDTELLLFRSARVAAVQTTVAILSIGSINILPNLPPTIALNSPANNANVTTTPSFTFTGTDPEGDPLTYHIQIDTVNTFDSQGGA